MKFLKRQPKDKPEAGAGELIRSLVSELHADNEALKKRIEEMGVSLASQDKIKKHAYLFDELPYSIRDPIYGNVPLCKRAFRTLDTQQFQRLKNLRQNGPAFHVYPGLTHSRFEHSVGVYHLMRLALQHFALLEGGDFEPEQGIMCLCLALVHDIGHLPYSHVLEEIQLGGKPLKHEEMSAYLLQEDNEISECLKTVWGIQPQDIASLLLGHNNKLPPFLYTLMDSTIDLDKMDYLCRDAFHAGVPYGVADVKWLISSLLVDHSDQKLLISDSGIGAVEELIFAKYLMYRNVYWHHTTREATAMIKRAVVDFLLENGFESLEPQTDARLRELCRATDDSLVETMTKIAGGKLPASTLDLLMRLQSRHLHKRVHVLYVSDPKGGKTKEADYMDAKRRHDKEREICNAIFRLPEWGSAKLRDWDVLIDVTKPANFVVDVKGVFFADPPPKYAPNQVVPWNEPQYVSYFTEALLNSMQESIRKVRYFYNPDNPKGVELRDILRKHPELY